MTSSIFSSTPVLFFVFGCQCHVHFSFHSDAFRYSVDIDPGHGASDLAAWLLDPESPNHRIGYCENFATAMAVMARTLGVPSRVVLGFTPGEPTAQQREKVKN